MRGPRNELAMPSGPQCTILSYAVPSQHVGSVRRPMTGPSDCGSSRPC